MIVLNKYLMTTIIEFYISDKERKNTSKLLLDYFDKQICSDVEEGFYDFTKQFCKSNHNNIIMAQAIYKDSVKNFLFNCQKGSSTITNLTKNIKKKKFNPYNFAFLRSDELDEDNWMKIILRKKTTDDKLNNLPSVEWKPCHRCKGIEYYFYQMQTRSADEPMTTFYICKKCGKTTSFNN